MIARTIGALSDIDGLGEASVEKNLAWPIMMNEHELQRMPGTVFYDCDLKITSRQAVLALNGAWYIRGDELALGVGATNALPKFRPPCVREGNHHVGGSSARGYR